jgi:hypothetical protein
MGSEQHYENRLKGKLALPPRQARTVGAELSGRFTVLAAGVYSRRVKTSNRAC